MGTTAKISRAVTLARSARLMKGAMDEDPKKRQRARRALRQLLADAKGTTMKVGQFLAGDAAFDDACGGQDPLRDLQQSVEPLPLETVLPLLDEGWGCPWQEVLATIEPAHAAASLGQVHRAILKEGGVEVAIKIRYPGIEEAVAAEMAVLGWLPGAGPVKRWSVDIDGYRKTLRDNMARELDYRIELQQQARYAQEVKVPGLSAPPVYPEISTSGILVQGYAGGAQAAEVRDWPQKTRRALGETLLRQLFASLFQAGLVHGDPHDGNYLFHRNGTVTQLDFGCVIEIPKEARMGLLGLIYSLREHGHTSSLAYFMAMGFDGDKLAPIAHALPAAAQALLRPFLQTGGRDIAFDVDTWRLSERLQNLLGELRWWFRSAGPAQLFLLLRVFAGLAARLSAWQVRLCWWSVLEGCLDAEVLREARAYRPPPPSARLAALAKSAADLPGYLHVQVMRDGVQKVKISLPAAVLETLEDVVPEDVVLALQESGQALSTLVHEALKADSLPHTVFAVDDGRRKVSVWLA